METEIIKELAIKYKVSEKNIKNIVQAETDLVKYCIENLKSIALPFFGKFIPNLNAYNKKQIKNNLEIEDNEEEIENLIDEDDE